MGMITQGGSMNTWPTFVTRETIAATPSVMFARNSVSVASLFTSVQSIRASDFPIMRKRPATVSKITMYVMAATAYKIAVSAALVGIPMNA